MALAFALPGCSDPDSSDPPVPQTSAQGSVTVYPWLVIWTPKGAKAKSLVTGDTLQIFENKRVEWNLEGDPGFGSQGYYFDDSRVLSVVGPVVSYVHTWGGEGGTHPTGGTRFKAVDLTLQGDPADICTLFDESSVVVALRDNPALRRELGDSSPNSMEELLQRLGAPCLADYPALPSSFAVVDVNGTLARVRFGVGHGCEVARGTFTEFEVELPIPPESLPAFQAAHKAGTLLAKLGGPDGT